MASESEYTNIIRTARYGREVRTAIANAIDDVHSYADGSIYEQLVYDLVALREEGAVYKNSNKQKFLNNEFVGEAVLGKQSIPSYSSAFIPVTAKQKLHFIGTLEKGVASESYDNVIFVRGRDSKDNADYKWISAYVFKNNIDSTVGLTVDDEIEVPAGATGMFVIFHTAVPGSSAYLKSQLKLIIKSAADGANSVSVFDQMDFDSEMSNSSINMIPIRPNTNYSTNQYIMASGNLSSTKAGNYTISEFIKIYESTIHIKGLLQRSINRSQLYDISFYAEPNLSAHSFVGGANWYGTKTPNYLDNVYIDEKIPVPKGARYFIVSMAQKSNNLYYVRYAKSSNPINEYHRFNGLINSRFKSVREIMAPIWKSRYTNNPRTIKLIGDSITHGVSGTGFKEDGPEILKLPRRTWRRNTSGYCWANELKKYVEKKLPSITVINNGCTGTTSREISEGFSQLVDPNDSVVICSIGTNDRNSELYLTAKSYDEIYFQAVAMKIPIIFVANIPASVANEKQHPLGHMEDIANIVYSISAEHNQECIDMYKAIKEHCLYTSTDLNDLLSSDRLHPNDRGYKVMFEIIADALGLPAPIDGATWL